MSDIDALQIGRDFLYYSVMLAIPSLLVSLAVGLLISVFQAATNIQEQTLTFVPRMLALALLFVVSMPWILQVSIFFTTQMIGKAAEVGH